MPFTHWINEELSGIRERDLLREPPCIGSSRGPFICIDGQELLNFSSNNYLGFANHPKIIEGCVRATQLSGSGATASRLVCGSLSIHREAEEKLAEYLQTEDSRLFSSGYAANLGSISALAGKEDLVLSDSLNHASLIDGCRLSRATVNIFNHLNGVEVENILARSRHSYRRAYLITETIFSMDGDAPDLCEYRAICNRYDTALIADEAHAIGVIGEKGRGLRTEKSEPDVLLGTLGKSFGLGGAFVAGSRALMQLIENRARSYIFSTGVVPALAGGVAPAIDLISGADAERNRLRAHVDMIRTKMAAEGYRVVYGPGAIMAVVIGSAAETMRISSELRKAGVFIQGIRPPTVPDGSARLRIVPSACHTDAHINEALTALEKVLR